MNNSPQNSHTWSRHIRNIARIYEIEDPVNLIEQKPPSKTHFKDYIITKITAYHEKQLRMDSIKNSKMTYFYVNVKCLNGRVHPAISGIISTQGVQK